VLRIPIKKGINKCHYAKILLVLVPGAGIEPARLYEPRDFKSLASTISATRAFEEQREGRKLQLTQTC
jgi:hypothetical protein